jgi:hypothetical protein
MAIAEDIALFEQSLTELVIKYEQYFLGLEKREPLKLLNEVERSARQYANVQIVNTMLKFKYNSLVAKLSSYKQYWNRINRLIEEGKYARDRFKMAMHEQKEAAPPQPPEIKSGIDPEVQQLYQQYIKARQSCNMPVENVTPDLLAAAIAKQKPAIIDKYRCSNVEFKVVVENGTPKIKARPRA